MSTLISPYFARRLRARKNSYDESITALAGATRAMRGVNPVQKPRKPSVRTMWAGARMMMSNTKQVGWVEDVEHRSMWVRG
jgi:hypothetical protein